MTLMEYLTVLYNLLVLTTLIVLVWQTILQRKLREVTVLESTYDRYLEFDRLIIDHPELQLYNVSPEVYDKLIKLDEKALRKRAYIELIFDCHELMYLKQQRGYYKFQEDYLKSLLANPHVREYWTSTRGNYRDSFVNEVNSILPKTE
jgi:hypothetical protein